MYRPSQESLIHEDAPTPEQIQRLAQVGVRSAVLRHRLKTYTRSRRAHYFIDELDMLSDGELSMPNDNFPQEIRHRIAGRVGTRTNEDGSRVWSLKYFDTQWVNSEDAGWQASRVLYKFECDRRKTLMASRAIRFVSNSGGEDKDLQDYIDNFYIPEDEPTILAANESLSQVTAEDCEGLTAQLEEYFATIEAHNL